MADVVSVLVGSGLAVVWLAGLPSRPFWGVVAARSAIRAASRAVMMVGVGLVGVRCRAMWGGGLGLKDCAAVLVVAALSWVGWCGGVAGGFGSLR